MDLTQNNNGRMHGPLRQIALLGSYLPRQCGIATFTADLARAIADTDHELTVDAIAMSDRDYVYPDRVMYEIRDSDLASYVPAADYVNRHGYDVLSVQHEYGLFGGDAGSYLMSFVREAKMPTVTTLHTVLREPSAAQKKVMDELLQLSERVVVMTQRAVSLLGEVHDVCPDKIDLIPHGIPLIEESAGKELRSKLDIEGPMILTFGLLSLDKGVQYVIQAMPKIVEQHPGATYIVVGATHPHVRASAGESYRESLVALAKELGVSNNVRFVDRFVSTEELVEYLAAMDIYVTPYLNPKQITSGTLAYAVGAGKAVISTPYTYAEELLDEGRGLLVPFRDPEAIADAVLAIQSDPKMRQEIGQRAAAFGKKMLWPEVGKQYLATFAKAKLDSDERLGKIFKQPTVATQSALVLPDIKLDHLYCLSDDTGILQHATFTTPNRSEGYCVDDNARALLFTAYLDSPEVALLQSRYLSFVADAYNPANGRFRNFMSYGRHWLESEGSEDSHGRSLWALGAIVKRCKDRGRREAAKSVFEKSAHALFATTSPRTWAYGVLAAENYLQGFPHEYMVQILKQEMAGRLLRLYAANRSDDWLWFEQSLAYCNARLPQALIVAGEAHQNRHMLEAGLESLAWLMKLQTGPDGVFAPIGSNGFYVRGEHRNFFDQQPVEASSSTSACLTALRVTGNALWLEEAHRAFRWFLGENMLGQPLYDKATGGCFDGLHPKRVNRNQGAESTLSWLCAVAELRDMGSLAVVQPAIAVKTS